MEICQHCGQYMKPFLNSKLKTAFCEFCGKDIAIWTPKEEGSRFGMWVKTKKAQEMGYKK